MCVHITICLTVYLKSVEFIVWNPQINKPDRRVTHQPPPIHTPRGEKKVKITQHAEPREDVYLTNPGILSVLFHAVGGEFSGSSCAVWVIAALDSQPKSLVSIALLVTKHLVMLVG